MDFIAGFNAELLALMIKFRVAPDAGAYTTSFLLEVGKLHRKYSAKAQSMRDEGRESEADELDREIEQLSHTVVSRVVSEHRITLPSAA
jgi:hypothetical protein